MWIITLIVLILILGLLVLVHEFGHFIFAKKSGVHIYEFSIGMGPVLFKKIGKKDGIQYRKMLEEMINGQKNNFIGIDMAIGIGALAAVAYAIVPITRALIYQIYKLRSSISDTLSLQAKFLEMNETCVMNNSTLDKDKKTEIVAKQKKLSNDLKKLSDAIRVKSAKSITDSERELKKDNSGFSIDALRDEVSNSAFELM